MSGFIYDSPVFQRELQGQTHPAGEIRFLKSIAKPGMRVIDIGANRGVTTVAVAREVGSGGHVYAFEPVPEYYAALQTNLARNATDNASAHQLALSNRTGPIRFYKHGEGSGITPTDDAEFLWVEATTVGDFLSEQETSKVDLLNLDCEGSELLVLEGAEAVLREQSPQIFCEIHHEYLNELGQSVMDVARFLTLLDYVVQPLDVEKPGKKVSLEECSHIWARSGPESGQR
jgi:FkbM family methyltransferase